MLESSPHLDQCPDGLLVSISLAFCLKVLIRRDMIENRRTFHRYTYSYNYTWYLVRGTTISVLPLVWSTATHSSYYLKPFIKMVIKKMVEYANGPPVSCTVCQPLSRKSSTHLFRQSLIIKNITSKYISVVFVVV